MSEVRLTACAALYHAVLDALYPESGQPMGPIESRLSRQMKDILGRGFEVGALHSEIIRLGHGYQHDDPRVMIQYIEPERAWLSDNFKDYMGMYDQFVRKAPTERTR